MRKALWFLTNGMAGFMDFGVGACIVALGATFTRTELPLWHIAVGGLLALLPDLDLVLLLLTKKPAKEETNHHLSLTHRPVLVLVPAIAVAWLLGGAYWAVIAACCVGWHYLHDTPPLAEGEGVAWLWPLKKEGLTFGGWEKISPVMRYGEWMERNWTAPTFLSLREISAGTVGLSVAMVMATDSSLAFYLTLAPLWAGAGLVWLLHARLPQKVFA